MDSESQVQHTGCWQWYGSDSSTAQDAASALTLRWHKQSRKACTLFNACHILYYYLHWLQICVYKHVMQTMDALTYIASKMTEGRSLITFYGWLTGRYFDDVIPTAARLLQSSNGILYRSRSLYVYILYLCSSPPAIQQLLHNLNSVSLPQHGV